MKQWLSFIVLFVSSVNAYAYYATNPPYQFTQGPYQYVPGNPIGDKDIPAFIKKNLDPGNLNPQVYKFDVDGNKTEDFVVFVYPGGGSLANELHIYLKKPDGVGYRKVSFVEDMGAGIEDIVDINEDGRWEIILTSLYADKNESYFVYDVYAFNNFKLHNVDKKFKGFPKFVLYGKDPDDKDATLLNPSERLQFVNQKNNSIKYEDIEF